MALIRLMHSRHAGIWLAVGIGVLALATVGVFSLRAGVGHAPAEAGGEVAAKAPAEPRFDSQHAAWSPDGTKLAFDTNRDGDNEIYLMNADGSDPRRLTHSPGRDAHPFWSPDGTRIVFQSPRDADAEGEVQIWVMNADGSDPRRLTDLDGFAGVPAWSPDGRRIVYQFMPRGIGSGAVWELHLIDAGGAAAPSRLTDGSANDQVPNWSPDGSRLVFYSDRTGDDEVYLMDADGTNLVRLTDDRGEDSSAAWSPDGTSIAFKSDRGGTREIYVMPLGPDGPAGPPVRLTEGTDAHGIPAFSPDGRRLGFHSAMDGATDVYVIGVDGRGLVSLTGGHGRGE